ncbi:DUF551 domain-containing protein [Escherichia coli]
MTTLTDKELIKEIKERISSLDVRDNIERRAYEIALASLEADPVAYIFKHPAGKLFWALTDESNKEQPDVIPVYADSPAPVVPDEIDVNDVPRAVTYFKTHRDCYADGWNACRAAMLQSQDSGIKDSWISCSERMPEETGDIIVVSDGIVMSGISYSRRDGFYIAALEYDDDEPIGGVTHWMPLPEPPQEVN